MADEKLRNLPVLTEPTLDDIVYTVREAGGDRQVAYRDIVKPLGITLSGDETELIFDKTIQVPPGSINVGDSKISAGGREITAESLSTGNTGVFKIQTYDEVGFDKSIEYDSTQVSTDFDIQTNGNSVTSGVRVNKFSQIVQNNVQFMRFQFKPEGGVVPASFRFTARINSETVDPTYDEIIIPTDPNVGDLGNGIFELKLANPSQFDTGYQIYITTEDISLLGENGYDGPVLFGDVTNSNFFPWLRGVSIPVNRISLVNHDEYTDAIVKTKYEANADTNAFTDSEKTKLTNIETGAEVNVQSDWTETNVITDSYIKNKPVPTYGAGYFIGPVSTYCTSNIVWYKVVADFIPQKEQNVVWDSGNKRWNYTGPSGEDISVIAIFTGEHDDDETMTVSWEIRVNGAQIPNPSKFADLERYDAMSMSLMVPIINIQNGDYIELFVKAGNTTENVKTSNMNFLVR